jgi:guanylate kinase
MVGPSGCGKTTLIEEMLRVFPGRLAVIKSVTTRPKRSADDDLHYRFVSAAEFAAMKDGGTLIQGVEYAGNRYGNDRSDLDAVLSDRHGICSLVEDGVRNFRDAGYRVFAIKVEPKGEAYRNRSGERALADAERGAGSFVYDAYIVNSFAPGGREAAVSALKATVRSLIG